MERYLLIGAVVSAVAGGVCDVRGARIPNRLTYGSVVAGFAVRAIWGWAGLKGGLIGLLVGGGIFYLLFLLGGMGGGDVKLMAAVGTWAGGAQAVVVVIASALAGGVLAIAYMVFHRRVRATLFNIVELVRHHLTSGIQPHPELNIRGERALRIPYGMAVAMGALYCLGNTFLGR
jgi:prepilin peptidase CpaA